MGCWPATVLWAAVACAAPPALADGEASPDPPVRLELPGHAWALLVDLPGFELGRPRLHAQGRRIELRGHAEETGLAVSIRMERARHEGDVQAYRDSRWRELKRKSTFALRRVRRSERGELALLEYSVPIFRGLKVKQQNLHALAVRDGVWIDLHLTKSPYVAHEDRLRFDAVVDSIRFAD